MRKPRVVAELFVAFLIILITSTCIFAIPGGRLSMGSPALSGSSNDIALLPLSSVVFQNSTETIETYDADSGELTLSVLHDFQLPAIPANWTFIPISSEFRLDGGTIYWEGLLGGTCDWIPERDRAECTGIITRFVFDYRYRYQPPIEENRFTHSFGWAWEGVVADVTWDLFYPESLNFIESFEPPEVEEAGHLRWTQQRASSFEVEATFTPSDACIVNMGIATPASQVEISPCQMDIATGGVVPDTNIFMIDSPLQGALTFSTELAHNDGGDTDAILTITSDDRTRTGTVTAQPQNASGLFRVTANVANIQSQPAAVTVPPQRFLQIIIGEAQGEPALSQSAVAIVLRNRLSSSLFFCQTNGRFHRCTTYNEAILSPGEFASTTEPRYLQAATRSGAVDADAYDQALAIVSKVFDGRERATLAGAVAFGSPQACRTCIPADEFKKVQDELDRPTCQKVDARTLGFHRSWFPILAEDSQAMVVNGINLETFVFVRPRPVDGCAVIEIPFS